MADAGWHAVHGRHNALSMTECDGLTLRQRLQAVADGDCTAGRTQGLAGARRQTSHKTATQASLRSKQHVVLA